MGGSDSGSKDPGDEYIIRAGDGFGFDDSSNESSPKTETVKIGGVDVEVIDGVGQLDKATLNAIINPTIQRINSWWRIAIFHLRDLTTLDSPFGDINLPPIKRFSYNGKIYTNDEINYIVQGHAHRHLRFGRGDSWLAVQLHNRIIWGHKPTSGEQYWARKGYNEYNQRKNW